MPPKSQVTLSNTLRGFSPLTTPTRKAQKPIPETGYLTLSIPIHPRVTNSSRERIMHPLKLDLEIGLGSSLYEPTGLWPMSRHQMSHVTRLGQR